MKNDNPNYTCNHLLACTTEQLKLLSEVLAAPALSDNPAAQHLVENIHKADYCGAGFFLSRYVVEQYYGGPEEGGWYAWNHDLCWSTYVSDVASLLEALNQALIDEDATPDVFDAIPNGDQIAAYLFAPEHEDALGEMSRRSLCLAQVYPYDSRHSYDPYVAYVVEFQSGAEQTTEREVYS